MVLKRAISNLEDKEQTLKVRVASKAVGAALKKPSPDEGDKSGVPVEKDIIDESNQQEPQLSDELIQELTQEDRELMDAIQNMKISVADLEKHSQLLNKEMLMKLQHKLLKMKRGGDDKDINEYYEALKSKLITLKDNEVLCATTGKACASSESPKNNGKSTDAKQQMNDNLSHKNNEQATEKIQEAPSKSQSDSLPERTGSDPTD